MIFENREYKAIEGFSEYFINIEGQVISTKKGRNVRLGTVKKLNPVVNSKGYYQYCIIDDEGRKKSPMQHQLLMRAFIPNINNCYAINHIDGNKLNNNLSNLEWCTLKENAQHAWATGLSTSNATRIPVHAYHYATGQYVASYESIKQAERTIGTLSSNIVCNLKGRSKQTCGLIFSYTKVEEVQPYKGPPVLKCMEIVNMETSNIKTVKSILKTVPIIDMHASSIKRRLAKGSTFYHKNFKVTRINY